MSIVQYLEDNEVLITTIMECINTGRVDDAVRFQQRLQQNLMWLAGIADTQPQPGIAAAAPGTPVRHHPFCHCFEPPGLHPLHAAERRHFHR